MKRNIFIYVFILILIIIIVLSGIYFLNLKINHTIITKLDQVNKFYTDNALNSFHIRIEYRNFLDENITKIEQRDIYRKKFILKAIDKINNNEYIYYQNTQTKESYFFNPQENNVLAYGDTLISEFQNFLELYYLHISEVKLIVNDDYYIVNFPTEKYYFDKENFRIIKKEYFSNKKLSIETIYTYFDNEEITDEMVSMPEI